MPDATVMTGTAALFRRILIVVGIALVVPFIVYETLLSSGAIPPLSQEQGGAIVDRLIFYAFVGGIVTILGGFALAFFVAKRGTVDVDQIVRDFAASRGTLDAIARLSELQDNNAFRNAVLALVKGAGEPGAPRGLARALELLRQGDTGAAETALADILDQRLQERAMAARDAAEAARHLGAIAYISNTAKAIEAYRMATELDPQDTWSWIFLGRLYRRAGSLTTAEEAFSQARAAAERSGDERDVSVAEDGIGDVRVAQGDRAGALEAYEQGRAIREKLAQRDPANADWQRDVIVSNVKLAEVAEQQGDRSGAAASYYQNALEIALALQKGGRLAPVDAWMIDDLETRLQRVSAQAAL